MLDRDIINSLDLKIRNKSVIDKARQLAKFVKIFYIAREKICFVIEYSGKKHFVFYFPKNKKWWCDCEWFALHLKECSHIAAVKLFLRELSRSLKFKH